MFGRARVRSLADCCVDGGVSSREVAWSSTMVKSRVSMVSSWSVVAAFGRTSAGFSSAIDNWENTEDVCDPS
jgi:hypothetical protein